MQGQESQVFKVSLHSGADNSCIMISSSKLQTGGLFKGDSVKVISPSTGKETLAIVLDKPSGHQCSENEQILLMNKSLMDNLGIGANSTERVLVKAYDSAYLGKVRIWCRNSGSSPLGEIQQKVIKPYFQDAYRPVSQSDTFRIWEPSLETEFIFEVVEAQNTSCGIASPTTEIVLC